MERVPPSIEDVYEACEKLDNEENKDQKYYDIFIKGAKGGDSKVKMLCAQMIVRYWGIFSAMHVPAFYALISLLEEADSDVRKTSVRHLSQLGKMGDLVDKIADVLSQMLQQVDDVQEMTFVANVLSNFLKTHPKDVISSVFLNVSKADDESLRLILLRFIKQNIKEVPPTLITKEFREEIEKQVINVLLDVTAVEFDIILEILDSIMYYETAAGRNVLLKIVLQQLQFDGPFPRNDRVRFDQILYFVERAKKYLPPHACDECETIISYMVYKGIPELENYDDTMRSRFLRALAELAPRSKSADENIIRIIFNYFFDMIPPLPSERNSMENESHGPEEELRIAELEAAAITLFNFMKCNKFLLSAVSELLESMRRKMMYAARLLQQHVVDCKAQLQDIGISNGSGHDDDDSKKKFCGSTAVVAENALQIIKVFSHKVPSFELQITPSWKMKKDQDFEESKLEKARKRKKPYEFYVPPGKRTSRRKISS